MRDAGDAAGPVLVYGAGAIGLFVGGLLAAAGQRVHCIARPTVVAALADHGLCIEPLGRAPRRPAAGRLSASTTLDGAPEPALVLLTVKGTGTEAAARELQSALPAGTAVLSLQNGVDNPDRLRRHAPDLVAIPGMVPFNIVQPAPTRLRQASSGRIAAADSPLMRRWSPRFAAAGLPLALHADMRPLQWGKLLVNLANPLNALSGLPLRTQLECREWRCLLALLQDEALDVLRTAGIRPGRATPLPSAWLPTLLRLPTPLFRTLARRMLQIDPAARLSMHEDRVRGRVTEIDDLCGAIVRLAETQRIDAPANRALRALVETAPPGRDYSAAEVAAAIRVLSPAPA